MHEMSLCESLLQIIEEQAIEHQFNKVKQIWLEVGVFSSVEVNSLKFCFDVIGRNTLVENCQLNIISCPGQAKCFGCGQIVNIEHRADLCPHCNAAQLVIHGGAQFRIKEVEVA